MKKVYIVGGVAGGYSRMFEELGYHETLNIAKADLVCFTGGADVSPGIYGDAKHHYTQSDTFRDQREAAFFQLCVEKDIPMVGICRGGQFLNVMSGGRMYQHVGKHTNSHVMEDARTGAPVFVSSTHHQMMMPSPEALVVATAALGGTREWYDGDIPQTDVSDQDIEVVYYPKFKALCFQPHPEYMSPEYFGMLCYFSNLLKEFFHG